MVFFQNYEFSYFRGRNGLTPVEICIDENMRQTLQVLQTLRPKVSLIGEQSPIFMQ